MFTFVYRSPNILPMLPVVGSLSMGLCVAALFWATLRLGRARPEPLRRRDR
jgi:hypothetical protein